jgi:hypothetical protein
MDPRIAKELSREEHTMFHQEMLDHCRGLVRSSRNYMQTFYSTWEEWHNIYRSYRCEDKNDVKAKEEGRPSKQVIPMTYAKVQTFVSFVMAIMTQRQRVFELDAQGVEDYEYKELCEKILDSDVKQNPFHKVLRQHLTDIAKFGLGIMKHTWDEEYVYVPTTMQGPEIKIFGLSFGGKTTTEVQKVLKRQGNKLCCISPFDFFPDTRYPLSDLHKGEFCADECDMSRNDLFRRQSEGTVAGIKHVETISNEAADRMRQYAKRSRVNFDDPSKTSHIVRVTRMQVKVTPSQFLLSDGRALGKEDTPTMYVVEIANDSRIIRCEPAGYLHGEFTYEVGQFDEDQHDFINQSLSDVLDRLQETIDWFMNSRVESVTRTIDNQLVVDPLGVDMATIVNRSRVILLKKGASRTGVDRYIKQLQVQDVTSRHMDDVQQLTTIMQMVSGVNENAMGQYHTGRRSATESRVVAQGAAARLKNIAESIWYSSLQPTGLKMLLNLRQGLSEESIIKVAGEEYLQKPELIQRFSASPQELVRQCDYFMYDGTLASEKAYMAQTLLELFTTVTTLGPQGLINLEISPKLLIEKIYELLGVGSLQQFNLAKDPQTLMNLVNMIVQQTMQQYAQQLPAPGANEAVGSQTPASGTP